MSIFIIALLIVNLNLDGSSARRLRVKTIANITDALVVTDLATTPEIIPESTTVSSQRLGRLRKRPIRPTTSTTERPITEDPSVVALAFESTKQKTSETKNRPKVTKTTSENPKLLEESSTTTEKIYFVTRKKPTTVPDQTQLPFRSIESTTKPYRFIERKKHPLPDVPVKQSSSQIQNSPSTNPLGANNVISVQSTYSINSEPVRFADNWYTSKSQNVPGINRFSQAVNDLQNYDSGGNLQDVQSSHTHPRAFIKSPHNGTNAHTLVTGQQNGRNSRPHISSKPYRSVISAPVGSETSHHDIATLPSAEIIQRRSDDTNDENIKESENIEKNDDSAAKETNDQGNKENDEAKSTKFEAGNGEEEDEGQDSAVEEKGSKEEESENSSDKLAKGIHDEETHGGDYYKQDELESSEKDDGNHFGESDEGDKGEKNSDYDDDEHFKEGHDTYGSHVVHKKDEWAKKTEFYDESNDGDHDEKYGAFYGSHGKKHGGEDKKGSHDGSSKSQQMRKKGGSVKGKHEDAKKKHEIKDDGSKFDEHEEQNGKSFKSYSEMKH